MLYPQKNTADSSERVSFNARPMANTSSMEKQRVSSFIFRFSVERSTPMAAASFSCVYPRLRIIFRSSISSISSPPIKCEHMFLYVLILSRMPGFVNSKNDTFASAGVFSKNSYFLFEYTLTGDVFLYILYLAREVATMSIASDLIRGHTETIILAHLLGGDSYGYQINKAIQRKTGGQYELKEATLYTAFRRLEEAGCITSYWGDEATGARRRYYAITAEGRRTYRRLVEDWREASALINILIAGEEERDA